MQCNEKFMEISIKTYRGLTLRNTLKILHQFERKRLEEELKASMLFLVISTVYAENVIVNRDNKRHLILFELYRYS